MLQLQPLFDTQRMLDQRIVEKHQLEGKVFAEDKLLALLVELGELANETRCFKFWSFKGPSESSIILEEYVDGLHFILSIGLDHGYEGVQLSPQEQAEEKALTVHFLSVFSNIEAFNQARTELNYVKLFEAFLLLGNQLGFSNEGIVEAYHRKNAINHERQDQNY
ncbi:dUTP diphosphatase [Pullulanibacillus sp. KACC 23026]|uniref:dUTP diphosphatase n=1 Tax=Pullulanibacillus sp. KACC 23026 TaxID=3028315 RepID=UPI0023AEEDA3|nr:dUTP diphosphatase [Pullulanibacillus sp. KACC 23026]WEG13922.1 dUTP diphosphatase [Pullulanibacillus sp. KACC 23026]